MNRKGFVRHACLSGACLCGFGALSMAKGNIDQDSKTRQITNDWLGNLLQNLDENIDENDLRRVLKMSSVVHYNQLKMDDILSDYDGRLTEFLGFLDTEWGWKTDYNKKTGIILADENKTHCVCPVLDNTTNYKTSAICYCSEGFAERMFSKVTGAPVTAEVISSVRRGDSTCIYKIIMPKVS